MLDFLNDFGGSHGDKLLEPESNDKFQTARVRVLYIRVHSRPFAVKYFRYGPAPTRDLSQVP